MNKISVECENKLNLNENHISWLIFCWLIYKGSKNSSIIEDKNDE